MVKRDDLIKFINLTFGAEWLKKAGEKDKLANGVQILGKGKVDRVFLGVSLNQDFLKEAVAAKADLCIFHHGFDPRTYQSCYPLYSQKRLKIIFENNLTIMGFHYVLDAHPQMGNNALIIKSLGAELGETLFDEWGYAGSFSQPQDVTALSKRCSQIFEHDVFAVFSGPKKVKTIGVVSGAGKPQAGELAEMETKGVELFITGETAESVPHQMKESGISYFACGHYASEAFGVQELGLVIKKQFPQLQVEFLDIPNPV